ncbi:hypothetical protein AXG93_2668s1030 [Marchantia polymorpha subsp. ruderalis]|uniref:Uncharacterized protein n=1 Tax=Marchantia polymorpha subsp. ruderalis TaxID=1480154 RepID=A0A176VBL5_MARPO|nr:hypothetical protein AXG93_2668s1030 [Marchantia polymorpha subsp. ruderalis]
MAKSESMEGDAIQGDHEANYKFDDVVAKDAIDDQADVTPQELVVISEAGKEMVWLFKFLKEIGKYQAWLTKLRNLLREKKQSLRDYTERFLDLLHRIPKTGLGSPFSVQQAVDWYVTGLTREMETFCRRGKCNTIEDVIASAEAFETSTLNRRGRERRDSMERKPKGGRRKRRGATPSSEEQSSDEGCTSSEEEETSSSEEERKRKKRGAAKKKGLQPPS